MVFVPVLKLVCSVLIPEKKDNRCPHLPPSGEETRMNDFRDQILVSEYSAAFDRLISLVTDPRHT